MSTFLFARTISQCPSSFLIEKVKTTKRAQCHQCTKAIKYMPRCPDDAWASRPQRIPDSQRGKGFNPLMDAVLPLAPHLIAAAVGMVAEDASDVKQLRGG